MCTESYPSPPVGTVNCLQPPSNFSEISLEIKLWWGLLVLFRDDNIRRAPGLGRAIIRIHPEQGAVIHHQVVGLRPEAPVDADAGDRVCIIAPVRAAEGEPRVPLALRHRREEQRVGSADVHAARRVELARCGNSHRPRVPEHGVHRVRVAEHRDREAVGGKAGDAGRRHFVHLRADRLAVLEYQVDVARFSGGAVLLAPLALLRRHHVGVYRQRGAHER